MSEISIERRLAELRDIARQYAKAKSNFEYIENFKKSKLAILMKSAEKAGYKTTASQEREARADPQYLELLEGLKEAIVECERLKWELEIARMGADLWRTQQANYRKERTAYGA